MTSRSSMTECRAGALRQLLYMDQDHFIFIVSQFLYIPWNFAQEMAANKRSLQAGDFCTPSITLAAAQTYELQMVEYLKEQISSYFSEKLLAIVCDAAFHKSNSDKSQDDISTTSGLLQDRYKQAGDPSLEFIKQICAVLALDQNVQHDILVMRRNLLRYLRVKEFAPEAEFPDSCPSFILPNVICSYCNDCRDLDLSRDSSLLSQEWRCAVPQCGQPYPLDVMENALLHIMRQRERIYHLQDLVCSRCNQAKGAHLTEQCTCGGTFRCNEDASEFRARMQIFSTIALHQKFQLLQECTSWILEAPNFSWDTSFSTVRPRVENPTSGLR